MKCKKCNGYGYEYRDMDGDEDDGCTCRFERVTCSVCEGKGEI